MGRRHAEGRRACFVNRKPAIGQASQLLPLFCGRPQMMTGSARMVLVVSGCRRTPKTNRFEMERIRRYAFSVVHELPKGGNEWRINSEWIRFKPFAKAVRGHWEIENSVGRVRDETFDEDRTRARQRRMADSLS